MTASGYVFQTDSVDTERARLQLLQRRYDSATFRRIGELGDLTGARCLEVGAGAGSVARWLGERVKPAGHVVALDVDVRFLDNDLGTNVTVREADILADVVPGENFDLVHCRALLMHLVDPLRAVEAMVGALHPGGHAVLEDADSVTLMAADDRHPDAAAFDRFVLADLANAAQHNRRCGRNLFATARAAGLTDLRHEATAALRFGDSDEAEFVRRSSHAVLAHAGRPADAADLAAWDRAMQDPGFSFYDLLSVCVWGRRAVTN